MKKLLWIFVLCALAGCFTKSDSNTLQDKEDFSKYELEDWPFPGANRDWVPSRDGLENSDTIVDGFPYNRI